MLKRSISGVVLVAVMISMILINENTYFALWALLAFATLAEFGTLMIKYGQKFGRKSSLVHTIGAGYILLGYGTLMFGFDEGERWFVLTFITLIWANDVGAYFIGSKFGKHKMAPKISPKKSWEGFVGGIVVAVITAIGWYFLGWREIFEATTPFAVVDETYLVGMFIVLGITIGIAAVLGDLVESWYKRKIGIKDSGNIIPGHGGMLDRFDALLMAAPAAWVFWRLSDFF